MMCNWQQKDWPDFTYDIHGIEDDLFAFASEAGQVSGMVNALPGDMRTKAIIDTMVAEAIKTSEIEGEYFSRQDVMSFIRYNLGVYEMPKKLRIKEAHSQ